MLVWLLERLQAFTASRGLPAPPGLGQGSAQDVAAQPSMLPRGGTAGTSGGEASGVTLPPIPSFNRRQYAAHAPLSSAGAAGLASSGEWGGAVVPGSRGGRGALAREGDASLAALEGLSSSAAIPGVSASANDVLPAGGALAGVLSGTGQSGGVASALAAVLSEVRPWGSPVSPGKPGMARNRRSR